MLTPRKPEDPFADQLEWLNNRYNPGYFLGGILRPEYRLSLGSRAKRVAGVLLLASGTSLLGGAVLFMFAMGTFLTDPWALLLGPLSLLAGLKMWRSAGGPPDPTADPDAVEQGKKIAPVLGMVLLATIGAALAAAVVLAGVVVVNAVARGTVHVIAAAAILILLALSRRRSPNESHDPEEPPAEP
jgi:hypothetical protein